MTVSGDGRFLMLLRRVDGATRRWMLVIEEGAMLMVGAVGGATACCSIFVAPQKEMLAMLKDCETMMVARLGVASPRLSRAGIDEGGGPLAGKQ
ncbi:hypothetical protein B296_00055742 [Ensete ventricosum]|uniref:Uncharacterized protein n=1 Tax=Ensete ventricosum TaxID=4639 RepID=A0A426X326_ENSVE|nr:hypothetical protein B296_00055742 [Ensete ventricosum]